ncbi:hypothetical protein LTR03_003475 [Friedmanniomyces endolithicus]|nr:hypothetical protein LTR03_003475 [Friedmanniomyces endolithicus]
MDSHEEGNLPLASLSSTERRTTDPVTTKARKSLDQRRSREVKREPAAVAADDDAEDGIEAEPKADKKRSTTLGRITSRLRRNRKTGDEPAEATAARESVVPAGTDAVSEVEDYEHLPAPLPSSSAHPVVAEKDAGLLAGRPGHAEVEDSSDDEWDEAADEHEGAGVGTAAVGAARAPKSEAEAIQHAFAVTDQTKHEDALAEKGKRAFGFGDPAVGGGAGVVAGPAREIGFGAGPGAGAGAVVPASSSYVVGEPGLERVASGAVDPCGEGGEDVTEHVGGLHKTLTANRLDPRVPLEAVAAGGVLGAGGMMAGAAATGDVGLGGNDAATNPVGDERKLGGEAIAPVTNTVAPLDGATAVDPIDSPAKLETNTLQARETPATGEKETESKGLRGFFGKFRKDKGATKEPGRITSSAGKYGGESSTVNAGAGDPAATGAVSGDAVTSAQPTSDPVTTGVPTSGPGGLVGVGGAGTGAGAVAGGSTADPRAVSPSSFRRRSGALDDLSSVSSSGAEEEEEELTQRRGRGGFAQTTGRDVPSTTTTGEPEKKGSGGLMGFLGFGGGKGKEGRAGGAVGGGEEVETDQFEEARDHFDEGLAPAPAFAAGVGGKGRGVGSPVRETRFREDV